MPGVDPICNVDGEFVPLSAARISAQDLGLLRGLGVFDFLRTYRLRPFQLEAHVRRLANSARLVGIRLPGSRQRLMNICQELCVRNAALRELTLRLIVTAGPTRDGFWPDGTPTVAILVAPLKPYPDQLYRRGCAVITTLLSRELPEAKTTNYLSARAALVAAKKVGALEALYVNSAGDVLEGTTSNIFAVREGVLITPREGILSGITRECVLRLVRKNKLLEIREEPLALTALRHADEAFLTSSNREVMPVTRIDSQPLAPPVPPAPSPSPRSVGRFGKVGPITQKVMSLFRDFTQKKGR
ncbi:MAG: aminotransferase class IV [Planctomycetota bacterium]